MNILVTGGAGFIGSGFVRMLAAETDWRIVNLDKLTYAGNLENLAGIPESPRYRFVHGDICDEALVLDLVGEEKPDAIVHFAAESHVDRSILSPEPVIRTNLNGTFVLLEAARRWRTPRFVHVSTDEVYGSLAAPREATEDFPLNPSSPYSAAKAGSDLLARSYFVTFKLPVLITRASNNYGPYQFPEKLIPLIITNALEDKPLPVYGDGLQVRDWLHVEDHARALALIFFKGQNGRSYNVGGDAERANIDVVQVICSLLDVKRPLAGGRSYREQMTFVKDRAGHDRRYAIDFSRLRNELGWLPRMSFEQGMSDTIDWYLLNGTIVS